MRHPFGETAKGFQQRELCAHIENNLGGSSVRPLRLCVKKWLQIGHPHSGSRQANRFTVVERCRQVGLGPNEVYMNKEDGQAESNNNCSSASTKSIVIS